MSTFQPQPTGIPVVAEPLDRAVRPALVRAALGGADRHCRQRELVRLSLLACPGAIDPTHRRGDA